MGVRERSLTILAREMYIQRWELNELSIMVVTQCPWIILRDGAYFWGFVRLIVRRSEAQQQRVNARRETSLPGSEKMVL
jgi:hypothetical protein